jgi:Chromo (CHRromatin Organisation MOdifier) domain
VFNTVLLCPARPSTASLQQGLTAPALVITEEGEEYEIEKVLDSRWQQETLEYLVKWVRYPREENLWVKENEMGNVRRKVWTFIGCSPLWHDDKESS